MRGHSGAVSAQARLKLQGAMRRGSGIGRSIVRNFAMAALLVPLLGVLSAKAEAPAAHGGKFADPAFTALRDLSQSLGGKAFDGKAVARKPVRGSVDVAADSLFDALRERSQGITQEDAAPAPAPKPAVVKRGKKGKAAVADAAGGEPDFVGSKVCVNCHEKDVAAFKKTMMGRLWLQNKIQCESCHGPASLHVKVASETNRDPGVGMLVTFRGNDPRNNPTEINEMCLGCHKRGDRAHWSGSAHDGRDVACTTCHSLMKDVSLKHNLKTKFEAETCFQCHKDRQAQYWRNAHMPLREGKMTCSDCHNPHGSATESLLRGSAPNDTCYKCHADKRGPFLFEHLPVRENCMNCHDPHGSVNEAMLKIPRPRLCATCHGFGHGLTSGVASVQYIGRSCQNCHTKVHGTNSPSGPLLHR